MSIVPLHNHSEYSVLDGLSTPKEIIDRCVEIGCPCCGITDHGVVTGHLAFAKEAQKAGIKPIFGAELYHGTKWQDFVGQERDAAHFVALAKNDQGLRNLWALVDRAGNEDRFRYVGRVHWDDLRTYSEGVVATSACIQGLVPQGIMNDDYDALDMYLDIYRDNFYIEIHVYPGEEHERLNKALVSIGQERGIPFVYATDAHFARKDQYWLHDAYVAIATKDSIYTPVEERKMWHPLSLYIQDESEIRESLNYLPESVVDEAIANSVLIGESCDAQLPEIKKHLPLFIPSECPWLDTESDADIVFIELVEQGIEYRYPDAEPEIWDRAITEMEVFLSAGLEHYFLLAWDVCQFCDDAKIERGPGRGSSAGSIIAYALGITDVDPIHYDLIFERFYNAGREKGLPDIDSDFEKMKRKDIRDYLKKRWGEYKVKPIGNTTRMKPKATLDRIWKGCGVTFEEKEALKKIIDGVPDLEILGTDQIGWSEELEPGKVIYVEKEVGKEIEDWVKAFPENRREVIKKFVEIARIICNRVEGYGVHASGIVVSDVDLRSQLPNRFAASKKVRTGVTSFAMDDVEARQFMKLDILGLRTLDVLFDWKTQMKESHDIDINWSGLDKEEHPDDMWELLAKGYTSGIFQIEGGFASKLCKEFKPSSIDDLAIIVSLNRPGPIRSGAPDSFIKRRQGVEDITYDHPILEDILEPTYGWFLYQEQVIAFFNKMSYTLSESDAVRKILGKKQPEKLKALYNGEGEWLIQHEENGEVVVDSRGYLHMAIKAGIDKATAKKIWRKLEDFAKYSFNKSHAIAYAILAFRTLFAKYYGAPEFYLSCIRKVPKDKKMERVPEYINEARRMKIGVSPPDIQRSKTIATIIDGDLVFGFADVKGVGVEPSRYLEQLRDGGEVDLSTPESLYEHLQEATKELLDQYKDAPKERKVKTPKQKLQENKITALFSAGTWDSLGERDDISIREKQVCEQELLGITLTDNSQEIFDNNFETIQDCSSYEEINSPWSMIDEYLDLCGIIIHIRPTVTRKEKKEMGIVKIEYEGETCEFAVFPQQWSAYKFLFKERTVGVFTLRKSEKGINFQEGFKLNA